MKNELTLCYSEKYVLRSFEDWKLQMKSCTLIDFAQPQESSIFDFHYHEMDIIASPLYPTLSSLIPSSIKAFQ